MRSNSTCYRSVRGWDGIEEIYIELMCQCIVSSSWSVCRSTLGAKDKDILRVPRNRYFEKPTETAASMYTGRLY